jgi:signal transduction histidine kinase
MSLPPSARRQLDEAAARLAADWRLVSSDAVSEDEVRQALADLVHWADRSSGDPEALAAIAATPLHARLLAALRRELLATGAAADPAVTLSLAVAVERVAGAFPSRWSDHFRDRLEGPSGVELVVEIAHDLRSPLTSILFLAETMLQGRSGPLSPLMERQIGLIYAAALGLSTVASDMVELVRGGDRLTDADRKPFSFAEVLSSVEDIVRPIAEEKGLALTLHPPAHDIRLGHPAAINRVLLNLTTNALKFTSSGGVEIRIDEHDGDRVRCTVTDTGRGIPAEAMATLFEPFRRRQQSGDYAFSGSGLGLSICRKLVEAMGSELEVHTELGSGTTFAFRLELPVREEEVYFG